MMMTIWFFTLVLTIKNVDANITLEYISLGECQTAQQTIIERDDANIKDITECISK